MAWLPLRFHRPTMLLAAKYCTRRGGYCRWVDSVCECECESGYAHFGSDVSWYPVRGFCCSGRCTHARQFSRDRLSVFLPCARLWTCLRYVSLAEALLFYHVKSLMWVWLPCSFGVVFAAQCGSSCRIGRRSRFTTTPVTSFKRGRCS